MWLWITTWNTHFDWDIIFWERDGKILRMKKQFVVWIFIWIFIDRWLSHFALYNLLNWFRLIWVHWTFKPIQLLRFNKPVLVVGKRMLLVVRMLVPPVVRMQVLRHGTAVVGHMELGQRLASTRPINFVGISVKREKNNFINSGIFRNVKSIEYAIGIGNFLLLWTYGCWCCGIRCCVGWLVWGGGQAAGAEKYDRSDDDGLHVEYYFLLSVGTSSFHLKAKWFTDN